MFYIFLTFCYFVYGTTAKDKDISKETIENSLENFQSITQNMTETLGLPELTVSLILSQSNINNVKLI